MKIKLLTRLAGPSYQYAPGDVLAIPGDVTKAVAADLCSKGFAIEIDCKLVDDQGVKIETATAEPKAEKAAKPNVKRRKATKR